MATYEEMLKRKHDERMKEQNLKSVIESILLVSEKPVSLKELANTTGTMFNSVQEVLLELIQEYKDKGINLIRKGDYFSLVSNPRNAEIVSKFLNEELRHDLSAAALETLAIITYKQPITKNEIEEVRGVNSDQMVRNLMIRGLIAEVGRKETPGRPILYGTTVEFAEYFGFLSDDHVPKIEELKLSETEQEELCELPSI